MSVIGLAVLALRAMEFTTLGIRWDDNAYGSIVWVLLGLHTTHVLTDLGDTLVLTALMFTKHARGRRFSDVSDNAYYWNFVVIAWLPIYALIYFAPRL
jgi:heme/copper-type cytochrome/quinol oxidase subunit 3